MSQVAQPVVNITAAAFTPISASTFARYVEISEDDTGSAQGFYWKDPKTGNVVSFAPSQQPLRLGSAQGALGGGNQALVGVPANFNGTSAATLYGNFKGVNGNTVLKVVEYN